MSTAKQNLVKQLNAILEAEEKALIKKHYPIIKKRFEGKFFKTINSYGSGKRWVLYTAITKIEPADVYDTHGNGVTSYFDGWQFQVTSKNEITISPIREYIHSVGREISKAEFNLAYSVMLDKMKKIKSGK